MVAVVIPAYKVKNKIIDVISQIGDCIDLIIVVDDLCPQQSGKYVEENCDDPRVRVLYHTKNKGVGGAVKTGYEKALKDGADIVVKLDGDGQMNPNLIPKLIEPIKQNRADYSKGNRFYDLKGLREMPPIRLFGNSILTFINKFVSGYWNIYDPTNGFTAIHKNALSLLELEKISNRYFFESDMLFRLNLIRAVVEDVPMKAVYDDEESSLRIGKIIFKFPFLYVNRFLKRIFYNYFLRDFNVASLQLFFGVLLFVFGVVFGICKWTESIKTGIEASAGTVILAALPIILGFQLLLTGLLFDINNVPKKPLLTQKI